MSEENIEEWMGRMLVLLDLDPMLYIDFSQWVEEEVDP